MKNRHQTRKQVLIGALWCSLVCVPAATAQRSETIPPYMRWFRPVDENDAGYREDVRQKHQMLREEEQREKQAKRAQAAESAVDAFFDKAPSMTNEGLLRLVAENPILTLSPRYPSIQEYIGLRKQQGASPTVAAPVPVEPVKVEAASVPSAAAKELTPEQMMKLAEMKVSSPAAYEEALKMFKSAGYSLQAEPSKSGEAAAAAPPPTVAQLLPLAEKGDVDAQTDLGFAYIQGTGVAKNPSEAFKWFLKAAEQGEISAMHNLGEMCLRGDGVPKDLNEAIKWYGMELRNTPASMQDDDHSLYTLEMMAYAQHETGERKAAVVLLRTKSQNSEKAEDSLRYTLACLECLEGNVEVAKSLLKKHLALHPEDKSHAKQDPDFGAIRSEIDGF